MIMCVLAAAYHPPHIHFSRILCVEGLEKNHIRTIVRECYGAKWLLKGRVVKLLVSS